MTWTDTEPYESKKASHGWPTDYYTNTIPPYSPDRRQGYGEFGFLLSKEGDNWEYAKSHYPVHNLEPNPLGIIEPPCSFLRFGQAPPVPNQNLDFRFTPNQKSDPTRINVNGLEIELLAPGLQFAPGGFQPASPQPTQSTWIATFVTVTNAVNFVSFESAFTGGAGAEGLLSVYWDTNTIGSVDEQAVLSGLQKYSYTVPRAESNSLHVLSFRLDTFTNIASSVVVSNVVLGFAGVSEPFTLTATTNTSNGLRVLRLTGQSGFNYGVEASTNLIDWTSFATLINTN